MTPEITFQTAYELGVLHGRELARKQAELEQLENELKQLKEQSNE